MPAPASRQSVTKAAITCGLVVGALLGSVIGIVDIRFDHDIVARLHKAFHSADQGDRFADDLCFRAMNDAHVGWFLDLVCGRLVRFWRDILGDGRRRCRGILIASSLAQDLLKKRVSVISGAL